MALTTQLALEASSVRTIQKVKSGLAIVPTNSHHAEKLLEKSQDIAAIFGESEEKAEDWHTYLIDYVPRSLCSLDGTKWEITEERVREEIQSVTGLSRTKVNWSKRTLENQLPYGTIVASFKKSTQPFRLF